MKQMEIETEGGYGKIKQAASSPPPPPPLPRSWVVAKPPVKTTAMESVTNQEIARFWRQKRMEEEDHLLAALKAAARIRARNLTEDDYKRFEEFLKDDCSKDDTATANYGKNDENNKELRVGIKDWWTKSKYAYLNQPAMDSMDNPKKRTSTYIPNHCFYKTTTPQPTSLGVF